MRKEIQVMSRLVFERLVCGGEDDRGRCIPGVGDPGFGSIQHPLVSVLTSCGGGRTCIAAVTCRLKHIILEERVQILTDIRYLISDRKPSPRQELT